MTATYTFDVFATLDGFGSYDEPATGAATGASRDPSCSTTASPCTATEQRMVFGANTYRQFVEMLAPAPRSPTCATPGSTGCAACRRRWCRRRSKDPLDWPDATLVSGDAVDVVARLKEESDVPLRSHGSLSMNRALMAAGLVDRVQVTVFPVITGQTGADPIFRGAADFDLELLEQPDARRQHPGAHLPAHPPRLVVSRSSPTPTA